MGVGGAPKGLRVEKRPGEAEVAMADKLAVNSGTEGN